MSSSTGRDWTDSSTAVLRIVGGLLACLLFVVLVFRRWQHSKRVREEQAQEAILEAAASGR